LTSNVTLNTKFSTHHHKHCSKPILHSPTVSLIQINREERNAEYLLKVNNIQQKVINLTRVTKLLLYLICHWLSLLNQTPLTS